MLLLFAALACAPDPTDEGISAPAGGASAAAPEEEEEGLYADTITTVGAGGPYLGDFFPYRDVLERRFELVDAEVLDAQTALVVGRPGYLVVELDDGALVEGLIEEDLFDVALDTSSGVAWATAGYTATLYPLDMRDRTRPDVGAPIALPTIAADVGAGGGRVLVAARDAGGLLFDGQGAPLATVEVAWAGGAAVDGDRALLADGSELLLLDLSGDAPVELDRLALSGEVADLALSGGRAAAALGSRGVQVIEVAGDHLVDRDRLDTYGGCFSVAIDGDTLWAAAWYHTVAIDLAPEAPQVLGHEDAQDTAMGVGAGHGRAIVADWSWSTSLARTPDADLAPEIVTEPVIWINEPGDVVSIPFSNGGSAPLEIDLSLAHCEATLDPTSLTLAPGERVTVDAQLPNTLEDMACRWLSDDPDEPSGLQALRVADASLGAVHEDFELMGFVPGEDTLNPYRLSDYRGDVVVLFYFAVS